jgi:hypothetical protein
VNTKHKVLIANRGEIAVRITQACKKLGLDFVCVYTAEDASSGHVALARELGGEKSLYRISSYHDANELLCIADESGATAVHPGYGFFAEDFRFARRVTERERSLVFLGPSWRVIRDLGVKINTKRLARSIGVPTVPGSDRPIYDECKALSAAGYDQIPEASDWTCHQNIPQFVYFYMEFGLVNEHLLGFNAVPMQATVDLNYYTLLNNANRVKFSRAMFEDPDVQATAAAYYASISNDDEAKAYGKVVEEEIG